MSSPVCNQAWQAEAIEDGRVSGHQRASFERHAAGCVACQSEIAALERLRLAARQVASEKEDISALERRRLRQTILRRANGIVSRPVHVFWPRAAALAVAIVLIAGLGWLRFARPSWRLPANSSALAAVPTFQISPSAEGRWHLEERPAELWLWLEQGTFAVHVDPLRPGQRFIARLPDGELEVKGTRFVVETEPIQTRRVAVTDGRVALRIHGYDDVLLGPGDAWSPRSSVVPEPAPVEETPSPQTEGAMSPPTKERNPARTASSIGRLSAGDEFSEAIAAFTRGDLQQADERLAAFEQHHPTDARAEDASFMRVMACSRRGDTAAARARAIEYLSRYPNGLRRREAERLSR
jgi:hypothetical protein